VKAAFPVTFQAHYQGKTRNAGGFDTDDGHVTYGEKYLFSFVADDGVLQTLEIADKALRELGFDTRKAQAFEVVQISGEAVINTDTGGRSYFLPSEVVSKQPAKSS
jgi:hypothetical protein